MRDVEAALRVAANPEDSTAFVRLLSAGPWRLDAAEILRLTNAAAWDGRPIYQAALDILREGEISVSEPPGAALPDDGARDLAAVATPRRCGPTTSSTSRSRRRSSNAAAASSAPSGVESSSTRACASSSSG